MVRRVIPGTCEVCGCVPGCEARDLTEEERYGLLDAGYGLDRDVFGHDIATPPWDRGNFNSALHHYCRAQHPKPKRPTWYDRVLDDGLADPEPPLAHAVPKKFAEHCSFHLLFTSADGTSMDYGPWSGMPSQMCEFPTYREAMEAAEEVRVRYGDEIKAYCVVHQTSVRIAPDDAWDKIRDGLPLDD